MCACAIRKLAKLDARSKFTRALIRKFTRALIGIVVKALSCSNMGKALGKASIIDTCHPRVRHVILLGVP